MMNISASKSAGQRDIPMICYNYIYLISISTCKFNFIHTSHEPALQNFDMDITVRAVGSDQPETSSITGGDVSDNSGAQINFRPADYQVDVTRR